MNNQQERRQVPRGGIYGNKGNTSGRGGSRPEFEKAEAGRIVTQITEEVDRSPWRGYIHIDDLAEIFGRSPQGFKHLTRARGAGKRVTLKTALNEVDRRAEGVRTSEMWPNEDDDGETYDWYGRTTQEDEYEALRNEKPPEVAEAEAEAKRQIALRDVKDIENRIYELETRSSPTRRGYIHENDLAKLLRARAYDGLEHVDNPRDFPAEPEWIKVRSALIELDRRVDGLRWRGKMWWNNEEDRWDWIGRVENDETYERRRR